MNALENTIRVRTTREQRTRKPFSQQTTLFACTYVVRELAREPGLTVIQIAARARISRSRVAQQLMRLEQVELVHQRGRSWTLDLDLALRIMASVRDLMGRLVGEEA